MENVETLKDQIPIKRQRSAEIGNPDILKETGEETWEQRGQKSKMAELKNAGILNQKEIIKSKQSKSRE